MKKELVLIDGNSIMNRAFYGIMSSKMLQTADGTFTNALTNSGDGSVSYSSSNTNVAILSAELIES